MSGEARRSLPRTGYPRRRAVTACQVCRERKKRCDNARPSCSFCLSIGARCEYTARDEASFDPSSLAILDRLSVLESLMRQHNCSSAADTSSSRSHLSPGTTPALLAQLDQPRVSTITPQSNTLSFHTGDNSRVRTDTILQWPVFEEPLASLPRYPFLSFRKEQDYSYLEDIFTQPRPPQDPSMSSQAWNSASPMSVSTDRADVEHLVDRFFILVHVKNPILDRQAVKQYCQEYYENGPQFDLRSCLVLIICALGAVAPEFVVSEALGPNHGKSRRQAAGSENLSLAHCYFATAEKRLGLAMTQSSSLAVQCLCLAGIYHMYVVNPMAAQAMFHAAGYTLQNLIATGIDSFEGSSPIGSSLFWACFKSEREIFAEIPIAVPALSSPGQTSGYPLPPQERFMASSTDGWRQTEEDSWYFFLSEIALRRISDKVAEAVGHFFDNLAQSPQQCGIEDYAPLALELERQVHAWREHLPPTIRFPDAPQTADIEWKQHTRGPYYRVLGLIFRPFIFSAIHDANSTPVVKQLAAKGLASAHKYLQGGHPTHGHHGRWLQLRYELKEVCILFAASQAGVEMPAGWYSAIQSSFRAWKYWEAEVPFVKSYTNVAIALDRFFESPETECRGDLGRVE